MEYHPPSSGDAQLAICNSREPLEQPISKAEAPIDCVSSVSRDSQSTADPSRRTRICILWSSVAFVCHNSTSLNDSYFVWHHDRSQLARPYTSLEDMEKLPVYVGDQKDGDQTMSQLLGTFCQKIDLPVSVPDVLQALAGVVATALLRQCEGTTFENGDFPFGIRGVRQVDRAQQLQLLAKKLNGQEVRLMNFGRVKLHKDEGMLERGLINYSILGSGPEDNFAFIVIVCVTDGWWTKSFGAYPSPTFDTTLAVGCFIFRQAMVYIQDQSNHSEAATLARQVSRGIFEESTRLLTAEEADALVDASGIEEDEEEEGEEKREEEEREEEEKKKRKKKQKKKKKKNKQKREGGQISTDGCGVLEEDTATSIRAEASAPEDLAAVAVAAAAATTAAAATASLSSTVKAPVPSLTAAASALPEKHITCSFGPCRTICYDDNPYTVVCPCCTASKETRYCQLDHLYSDIRSHFLFGRFSAASTPSSSTTAPTASTVITNAFSSLRITQPPRPFIHEIPNEELNAARPFPNNILERHRQAIYRAMNPDINTDYFVFDDIDHITMRDDDVRMASQETRKAVLQNVRGIGRVCAVVSLPRHQKGHLYKPGGKDDQDSIRGEKNTEKARFNEAMVTCLRLGYAAGTLQPEECQFIFITVRTDLAHRDLWDARMEERMAVQMGFEFGWRLPTGMRGWTPKE